jgi:hypothetical protein
MNPLAIGVTLGGLLLDVLVPRPKPQVGVVEDALLFSPQYRLEDTFGHLHEQHERPPVVSGSSR